MPNRIIKQTICTSESMASLTWFEQVLFIRLLVSVDDYGRYDARPAIIKGALFPLDNVTAKAVEDGIQKLSTHGMILLYKVGGKPYLELTAWLKHNTPRAKDSKFPAPEQGCAQSQAGEGTSAQMFADASTCEQMQANAPDIRIRYSKSDIRDPNTESICPERGAAPSEPPVITLLLNDKSEYPITQKDIDEWKELYPAVDIMQELRKMKGWCNDNPANRKTRAGIKRFIGNWLRRAQDGYHPAKGGGNGAGTGSDRKNPEYGAYL